MISIKCDVDAALAQMQTLDQKQLPFIIAKSLTNTAQEAQKAVQFTAGQVFHLRNDWTTKGIKITPATKQTLVAEVYTNTANTRTGAPDYLVKQEYGGPKMHHGTEYFAIPTKYIRAIQPRTIPAPMRPYNLLPVGAAIGTAYKGRLEMPGTGNMSQFGRVSMRKLKKLGTRLYHAFKQYDKKGTLCIFVRLDGRRDAEPWYVLVRNADIKPRLHMQATVDAVVQQQFEEIFVTVAREVGISIRL